MGFFKDFFAKKHDTEDEERGGTIYHLPRKRVMALILLVKKDAPVPSTEKAQARACLANIFFSKPSPLRFAPR